MVWWKTDPSRGDGRGTRAAGRDGRDGPRDSADVGPWQPSTTGDDRPPGTAACSRHGRDHTPRRWRRGGCSVGRSSGVAAGPRRRSARGTLRLDSERQPWHNSIDRLGLSELGAVTRVPGGNPGPSPRVWVRFYAIRTSCCSSARRLWTLTLLWTRQTAPTGACKTAQTRFRTAPTAIIIFFSIKTERATRPGRVTDRCRESVSFQ